MERVEGKSIVTTIKKKKRMEGRGERISLKQSGREKAFANKDCGRLPVGC